MNTDPDLMGIELFLMNKSDVIGGDHWQVQLHRQSHRLVNMLLLSVSPRTLQFQVKAIGEDGHPGFRPGFGFIKFASQQCLTDVALLGCRQGDKPLALRRDPFSPKTDLAERLTLEIGPG